MVKIYFSMNGEQQEAQLNKNDQLTKQFPNFKFFIHEEYLFSTQTIIKNLMKNDDQILVLTAISEEDVIEEFNKCKDSIKCFKMDSETQILQANQIAVEACQDKEVIQQKNIECSQYKQFIKSRLSCLSSSVSSNLFKGQILESQIIESTNLLDGSPIQVQKLQPPLYRKPSQEEEQLMESTYLLQTQIIQQFIQQTESDFYNIKQAPLKRSSNSQLVTIEFRCCFCQLTLFQNYIQTPCQHSYHEECLLLSVNAQLMDNSQVTRLNCLCSKKLPNKILGLFKDKQFIYMLQMKLFYNQLEEIKSKKKYQYIKCEKEFCEFFYIKDKNTSCYCPSCCQIINNK